MKGGLRANIELGLNNSLTGALWHNTEVATRSLGGESLKLLGYEDYRVPRRLTPPSHYLTCALTRQCNC